MPILIFELFSFLPAWIHLFQFDSFRNKSAFLLCNWRTWWPVTRNVSFNLCVVL